ncbi:hypothetical protein BX600DRAFT_507961 [Xylariales sp. PMI_506]|nr:hypothetical protein BX600DRAFT_507961 [Xylariales sp. PMI_506]
MNQLETIFSELGISQYLGIFIDQGFDSWETILDITESDLDALGVKLGHRRKLQRRIANYRGLAPVVSLVSPTRTSIEDPSQNANKLAPPEIKDVVASAKRKYRRHPKPDENAPERPPSAYVLFSNKMREDLKGQNLSFTEIAKLVGENWQSLDRAEKDPYETQAQEAKERYNREISEYKKTDNYRRYTEYLHGFRKRQALQDKDTSKRFKVDSGDSSTRGSSTSATSMGPSTSNSNAESGSESQPGSEPPPARQHRLDSVASQPESHVSPAASSSIYQRATEDTTPIAGSQDEGVVGRPRGFSSPNGRDPNNELQSHRYSGLRDSQRAESLTAFSFPPIANPNDQRAAGVPFTQSPDLGIPSLIPSLSQASSSNHSSSNPPFWSRPPSLRTEQSSTSSSSSKGSYPTPRTPSDSSLPIHALLSSKPEASGTSLPLAEGTILPQPPSNNHHHSGRSGDQGAVHVNGMPRADILSTAGLKQPPLGSYPLNPPPRLPPVLPLTIPALNGTGDQPPLGLPKPNGTGDTGYDGMNALLRASDIVGRQNHS